MRNDATWGYQPRKPRQSRLERALAIGEIIAWVSIPVTAVGWLVAQVIGGLW